MIPAAKPCAPPNTDADDYPPARISSTGGLSFLYSPLARSCFKNEKSIWEGGHGSAGPPSGAAAEFSKLSAQFSSPLVEAQARLIFSFLQSREQGQLRLRGPQIQPGYVAQLVSKKKAPSQSARSPACPCAIDHNHCRRSSGEHSCFGRSMEVCSEGETPGVSCEGCDVFFRRALTASHVVVPDANHSPLPMEVQPPRKVFRNSLFVEGATAEERRGQLGSRPETEGPSWISSPSVPRGRMQQGAGPCPISARPRRYPGQRLREIERAFSFSADLVESLWA